jgi:hypothetical protein
MANWVVGVGAPDLTGVTDGDKGAFPAALCVPILTGSKNAGRQPVTMDKVRSVNEMTKKILCGHPQVM